MKQPQPKPTVRCAIYTRKSSEEGLEQEFNSLDAQRESGEAYIASQKAEGWICLPDRYDDGGFTGGNMDRPALKRLMADIESGGIDCVVVYKVDRLSRSLLDFARLLERFEKHNIAFVSVTQRFSTTDSMGRLTLNMLLSFAQFEREIISERTRDKIAAARRKGKWSGGHPILGYDVDAKTFKLVVNEDEANRVRQIFHLYLEHEALIAVVRELDLRGWTNKRWTTRKGRERGGRRFDKATLYSLLTNAAYIGKVKHRGDLYDGEHAAIVDPKVWQRVQQVLARNGRSGGAAVRNKYGALLKGILHCVPCGCSMGHSYSSKNGRTRYRYYICLNAQKRGWDKCPSPSVPAEAIERLVLDQVRELLRDPSIVSATLRQARKQAEDSNRGLSAEQKALERELKRCHADLRRVVVDATSNGSASARLADLQERIRVAEQRSAQVRAELRALEGSLIDENEVAAALTAFDPVWDHLSPKEQARVVQLLVKQADYDGAAGKLSLTFHSSGFAGLAEQVGKKEAAA